MKSTLAVLIVIALTLQITTTTATFHFKPIFHTLANASKDVLDDVGNFVGRFEGRNVIRTYPVKDLELTNYKKLSNELREGLENVIRQNEINFQLFVQKLYRHLALRNYNNPKTKGDPNVLDDMKKELKPIVTNLDVLQSYIDSLENKIQTEVSSYEDKLQADWNRYAQLEIARLRNTYKDKPIIRHAQQLIETVIHRYEKYINSCANEFTHYIKTYQQNLIRTRDMNRKITFDLRKQIEDCEEVLKNSMSAVECEQDIRNEFWKLKNLPNVVKSSIDIGNDLLKNGFSKHACVVSTVSNFEEEKLSIRLHIDKLRNV